MPGCNNCGVFFSGVPPLTANLIHSTNSKQPPTTDPLRLPPSVSLRRLPSPSSCHASNQRSEMTAVLSSRVYATGSLHMTPTPTASSFASTPRPIPNAHSIVPSNASVYASYSSRPSPPKVNLAEEEDASDYRPGGYHRMLDCWVPRLSRLFPRLTLALTSQPSTSWTPSVDIKSSERWDGVTLAPCGWPKTLSAYRRLGTLFFCFRR